MNKEEISYKLLELYYIRIYRNYTVSLDTLIKKYLCILNAIQGSDNE